MDSFFSADRLHFFRPLTGKYREQVMACLRALYARLYSSLADYSRIVQRDLVMEVFQEAITRTPVLDASEDDTVLPVRGDREQAGWMLNLLLEYGWLERHVDEVTLTSTYAFSRIGRLFTQPMHELGGGRFRTRHRNTRNTCNALRSFLDKSEHEASDLLDAYEYSERIVSDFSDVIAELEERKRELLRDVEAQQLVQRASDEFFDFMEKEQAFAALLQRAGGHRRAGEDGPFDPGSTGCVFADDILLPAIRGYGQIDQESLFPWMAGEHDQRPVRCSASTGPP